MSAPGTDFDKQNPRIPLDQCGFDADEQGLLAVLRHLMMTEQGRDADGWKLAQTMAIARWGESQGLSLAYRVMRYVEAVLAQLPRAFEVTDPLAVDDKHLVTPDELAALRIIHHMRRDETPPARAYIEMIAMGQMDVDLIRAGLALSQCCPQLPGAGRWAPAGAVKPRNPAQKPYLRVVK